MFSDDVEVSVKVALFSLEGDLSLKVSFIGEYVEALAVSLGLVLLSLEKNLDSASSFMLARVSGDKDKVALFRKVLANEFG